MLKKLLVTGADGMLGAMFRERLTHICESMRVSCRDDIGDARDDEEICRVDFADRAAVMDLVDGCDGIIHMAGQSTEADWTTIRDSNIEGVFNLYEAARKSSVTPRIVFASSNHAIGFYRQTERIDASCVPRPDSLYGVSKVFGESMASLYHDKFGIETAIIRIGSCFPEPKDHRMLATWLSADDFVSMMERVFAVPRLGCPIIYGASDNAMSWWDNHQTAFVGWRPKDDAEVFRADLDARMDPPAADDPRAMYHGGTFCADGIHED